MPPRRPRRLNAVDDDSVAARSPATRREFIRRRVIDSGYASIEDLARDFEVSQMTLHRDLDALAADGWLIKIRGGATANPAALVDAGIRERSAAMRGEKLAIAELAAQLITPGQTIFLDDSTTSLALVPYLIALQTVTVATNSLPVVTALGSAPSVELHVLGGQYVPRHESCQGLGTVHAIERLRADLVFMSTTAVLNGSCLHRSEATIMVREAFLRHSSRRVLLVDHAKFGRPAAHVLCAISDFDVVVTDSGVDPADLAELRQNSPDVRVAHVEHWPRRLSRPASSRHEPVGRHHGSRGLNRSAR